MCVFLEIRKKSPHKIHKSAIQALGGVVEEEEEHQQQNLHKVSAKMRTTLSLKGSVTVNALRACVYIYIRQLSSFRAPMLWFIDLTVTTCHIQYTFLSLCQCFTRENGQNTRILEGKLAIFRMI